MSSKWWCVLAVVCLSVILLSLDADAQPTVDDESSQCGSASPQEVANMVSVIASNQQEMMDKMQENVVEMRKLKNESDRVRAEMEEVKRLVLSRVNPTDIMVDPSKQQRVSALACEYAVCLWFHYTDLTRRS